MQQLLQIFILIPLLGFIFSLFFNRRNENVISSIAISAAGIQLLAALVFSVMWLTQTHPVLDLKYLVLYKTADLEFFIDFYFDKTTAAYLLVGSAMALIVTIFSRYYIHREKGFKRFFNTLLFFFVGYNLVIFAGNFDTLFIGWELLGISSFLLISFYRDRYLPVKNGFKVITIYRLSDVCLILAIWMSHHLWHENIPFSKLSNIAAVAEKIQQHQFLVTGIALMLIIAASIKSAQVPFSSWLPRAMEGPTTSSAIFYGSLSVHIGVFLLIRTYPLWESLLSIKILIISIGAITGLVAAATARVQSTVKTQIAYASIAQIGLIFIEVALGFHSLALFHFAGNAFLRTYQLLVSPSVLNYKIHDMFFHYSPKKIISETSFFYKLKNTLYIFCVKEWNIDLFLFRFLWSPFKKAGNFFSFINLKIVGLVFLPIFLTASLVLLLGVKIQKEITTYLPVVFLIIALILVLKSFVERKSAKFSWLLVLFNHFWIALAILFNGNYSFSDALFYLSGVIISGIVGYACLIHLNKQEQGVGLNQYHGHVYEYPKLAFVFLVACLGLSGFPITPTFLGIDIIFSHIHKDQIVLAVFVALSFLLNGVSLIRIYARVFLGQHIKTYHEIAFKSS